MEKNNLHTEGELVLWDIGAIGLSGLEMTVTLNFNWWVLVKGDLGKMPVYTKEIAEQMA